MRDLFTLTLMQQRSDVATISLFIFYEFLKLHPSPCLPHVDWKGINSNHLVFPQSNVLPPITSHICFCKTGYHSILPLLPLMTYCVTCRLFGMIESLWFLLIFCFRYFFSKFSLLKSKEEKKRRRYLFLKKHVVSVPVLFFYWVSELILEMFFFWNITKREKKIIKSKINNAHY